MPKRPLLASAAVILGVAAATQALAPDHPLAFSGGTTSARTTTAARAS